MNKNFKLNSTNIALLLHEATQKYRKLTHYSTKCPLFLLQLVLPFPSPTAEFSSVFGHSTLGNYLE